VNLSSTFREAFLSTGGRDRALPGCLPRKRAGVFRKTHVPSPKKEIEMSKLLATLVAVLFAGATFAASHAGAPMAAASGAKAAASEAKAEKKAAKAEKKAEKKAAKAEKKEEAKK
jgi:hypothetical protein